MNIFYLHHNPKICVSYYVDRHVVKMILETCQLLCTAIWVLHDKLGISCSLPVRPTHINHPSSIWTRANKNNWAWLKSLGIALCKEYTYRYGKIHKYEKVINTLLVPDLPDDDFFEPTPAMPDCYKIKGDSLASYKNYYILGKSHLHFWKNGKHAWKKREIPEFIKEICGYSDE